MHTFVIRYLEEVRHPKTGELRRKQLGCACFDDVQELLLPDRARYEHLYFTAKFAGRETRRWRVNSVGITVGTDATPTACDIVLKAYNGIDVYLNATLAQGSGKIGSLLQFGTLVEVDYGFIPALVSSHSGELSHCANTDALLRGEMHKRRLALVVRASKQTVQVVPVTSNAPDVGDKTCFEIAPSSLRNLVRYSASGLRSWAVCGMVDSVSTSRILPPETSNPRGGNRRKTSYPERLHRDERIQLLSSLAHFVGIPNYDELREHSTELRELRRKGKQRVVQPLLQAHGEDPARSQALKEVASDLAKHLHLDIEKLVRDRIEFNADVASAGLSG